MVSPETRYWLRLETGDRQGDKVSIPECGLTVGRRPENALRLSETSVSGRHAELVIVGEGVVLRDLGSTNGTRVGSQKIEEQRLAHGDTLLFGNARAVFLDGQLEEPVAATRADDEGLGTVSQERLASAGRRSIWGLVGVLVLAGGAFAAWTFLQGKDKTAVAAVPVIEVAGNRIADGSFEDAERPLDWETSEAAPTVFYRDPSFFHSGAFGLGADLEAGTWSLARSPKTRVRARRSLHVKASLSAAGGAGACIGVELSDSTGANTPYRIWGPAVWKTGGFEFVELVFDTVAGYDEARVFVEASARGEFGTVALDDVSLVDGSAEERAAAALLEYEAHLHGDPPTSASLKLGDELILGGIRVQAADTGGNLPRWPAATLAVESTGKGIVFRASGAPADAELAFLVNPASTDGRLNGNERGWVATTGPEGFRSYSSDFEQEQVTGLLLGRGINLMRFGFAEPVKVVARLSGNGLHVTAGLGAL
ncbi:MAG: FHA domain-containing protein, partial [Planctomycetota bacterium]|nr:FHA domain-containing protein [Planctomycetota bacterium]